MKRLRLLWNIVRTTGAERVFTGFLVVLGVAALLLPRFEPEVEDFGDALWFLFVSFTTIGYGDIVPVTMAGRLITVFVALYGILVVALATGVIVGYYSEILRTRANTSLDELIGELENLPDLSREELLTLAQRIRNRHILR
ncbi:potassium channel family protein [Arthrobacter sp. zg-Y820]|uniref:potassium channel family protein n=1 Tax=unclassified Arthrobacter TaxID=235627 RepID=UPI001E4C8107|nr:MULTISPECIES: potassium channel family protein [unclassified Arthrobacter]MCC9196186.1 potassium channel family protein [Arthrobacter sp. zg-Y820]MDK1279046.1 potassium channel family protein [Arthrobacter sp. zg.Y820]WIB08544.1 potassium channel family protein [Arthrobacter sp. zg-Y820]